MHPASAGTILVHTEDAPVETAGFGWRREDLSLSSGPVTSGWPASARIMIMVVEDDDEADIQLIESRREEPGLTHDEVKARLRADGLLPD